VHYARIYRRAGEEVDVQPHGLDVGEGALDRDSVDLGAVKGGGTGAGAGDVEREAVELR